MTQFSPYITTIREALQILRADKDLSQLEIVLAFFATFVLDSALVQQIMRWDMAVLRESPWYQEILERGRIEEILSDIEMILEAKFSSDGLELMSTITQVSDLERLKVILRNVALANTFEELQQAL